jgi:PIN domain nuclease of toxin-antitoxin system
LSYLLDTCTFLWIIQGNRDELSRKALDVYRDPGNEIYLSSASSWEIVIKHELGKLTLSGDPNRRLPEEIKKTGCQSLPIYHNHTLEVSNIRDVHSDPFDRVLVSQARIENLSILTPDHKIDDYEVPVIW